MKYYSFTAVTAAVALCIFSLLLAQCNPATEGDASKTNTSPTYSDTTATPPKPDSSVAVANQPAAPDTVAPAPAPVVQAVKTPNTPKAKATKAVATKPKAPRATPTGTTPAPKPVQPDTQKETPPAPKPPATHEAPPDTPASKPEKVPDAPKPSVSTVAFTLKTGKAVVHGSSTLHDWDSKVTQVEGKGSFQLKDNVLVAIKNVEVKIDVKGIKSKEGKKMDDKTYETFHSDKNPYITFTCSTAQVKNGASGNVTIEAEGSLSMAGVTKPVTVTATGKQLPNGDLQLSVSKKLKMTDFKMEPPVMMLGTLKVGNEITVSFDFVLERK